MQENKPIRVLIVDDEERFRVTVEATLNHRGFLAKAVANGPEAIEEIKKGDIDVIVLDLKMPGMNGNEVLREIKNITPGARVIMLTGHGTLESALEGWIDGIFTYLTKPCGINLLAEKIRDAYKGKERSDNAVCARWSAGGKTR